ncbi:MAG: hypothetical protein GQ569_01840 [Methylococcaceae bacterium]|nr:hypothetical protein [Methylococcaceae bacterium]
MTKNNTFEEKYPKITFFTDSYGWIEIGFGDTYNDSSFIKAYDQGGTVWEGKETYKTTDEALDDLEQALSKWYDETIGE